MSDPVLRVRDLEVAYGKIKAVQGVSFDVESGSLVTLIGANGAGKTSTLASVAGLVRPKSGSITFNGKDITRKQSHQLVKTGLVLVPEGRQILGSLTVEENLKLGRWGRPSDSALLQRQYDRFPILNERRALPAGSLSGGEQQMLAIARAMMAEPSMVLLDEPTMGLAPKMVDTIFETIDEIRSDGVTVLLVEQNARRALNVADHGYVIENGTVALDGPASELQESDEVKKAYLGGF
ncbi:ABC transporter ATP-binding protein [Haloglycomyces albus]|uniref:ABC transporter ATP-binding protein n=1 Tax=Haloglycomyces albus TaxID=526067 RepID=UPI00046CD68A|nr:ABC transporter ATP-binding protein [Haloglycomyces albus]